jgi:predicted dinucleotide-binding enzyme
MGSKKLTRSLLLGVRRLFAGALRNAATLADIHPMVVTVTPPREKHHERGVQSTC